MSGNKGSLFSFSLFGVFRCDWGVIGVRSGTLGSLILKSLVWLVGNCGSELYWFRISSFFVNCLMFEIWSSNFIIYYMSLSSMNLWFLGIDDLCCAEDPYGTFIYKDIGSTLFTVGLKSGYYQSLFPLLTIESAVSGAAYLPVSLIWSRDLSLLLPISFFGC